MIMKKENPKNPLKDLSFDYIESFIDKKKLNLFFELFENGPIDPRGCIPFYWCPTTTSHKFPQFSHILLGRDDASPRSPLYDHFREIILSFLDDHNLKYKQVLRSCLNITYFVPNHSHTDPHVDHDLNHYVIILYLDDSDGNTIIFNKEFKKNNIKPEFVFESDKINKRNFPIKKEVKPKCGKIICFNGKYYHALRMPSPGQIRKVCVFNIEF